MQPHSTQVPPRPSRSMTPTERPSCAQRMAQTYPAGPPPRIRTSYDAMSVHEQEWILNQTSKRNQELGAGRAVDHPMIAAHRDAHPAPRGHRAVHHDGLGLGRADRENAGFGWVDDRGELVDPEHAEVRDRERRTGILFGLELSGPRPGR